MTPAALHTQLQLLLADEDFRSVRHEQRCALSPRMSFGRHFGPPSPTARPAAVMLLVETDESRPWTSWTIPLTVRPNHLPSHPGQISLPGGGVEGDETLAEAARRELQEELGVDSSRIDVLGEMLPLYVYNSNFFVTPFLAVAPELGSYEPCVDEVDRLVHLPLGAVCNREHYGTEAFTRGLLQWRAPVIRFGDATIWGATAMVLGEFKALLESAVRHLGAVDC